MFKNKLECEKFTNISYENLPQATLELGSLAKQASTIASDTWSQILSGCPSETHSEVNKKVLADIVTEINSNELIDAGRL